MNYTITLIRVMRAKSATRQSGCAPKPTLSKRPLINVEEAAGLAAVFGVMASKTRLRLLHALERQGELSPTLLADMVGVKVQAVSNQLQMLTARGIVSSRRNGSFVLYRVEDPCISALLDRGWCLAEDAQQRARPRLRSDKKGKR